MRVPQQAVVLALPVQHAAAHRRCDAVSCSDEPWRRPTPSRFNLPLVPAAVVSDTQASPRTYRCSEEMVVKRSCSSGAPHSYAETGERHAAHARCGTGHGGLNSAVGRAGAHECAARAPIQRKRCELHFDTPRVHCDGVIISIFVTSSRGSGESWLLPRCLVPGRVRPRRTQEQSSIYTHGSRATRDRR